MFQHLELDCIRIPPKGWRDPEFLKTKLASSQEKGLTDFGKRNQTIYSDPARRSGILNVSADLALFAFGSLAKFGKTRQYIRIPLNRSGILNFSKRS